MILPRKSLPISIPLTSGKATFMNTDIRVDVLVSDEFELALVRARAIRRWTVVAGSLGSGGVSLWVFFEMGGDKRWSTLGLVSGS